MMDTEKLWTLVDKLETENRLYSQASDKGSSTLMRIWMAERKETKKQIAEIIGERKPDVEEV